MHQVLVVEDSKMFGSLVKSKIELELNFDVKWSRTYSGAARLINDKKSHFLVAVLDLNLPDAPMGEIVDLVLANNIPPIVCTGEFGKAMRETIWAYKVVDYVVKESIYNVDYIVSLIRRIQRNKSIKVLVVDDSITSRRHLSELLQVHQYDVYEACDGLEALNLLDELPDIRLVLTDYYMPNMDGFRLTEEIRDRYGKGELAIIGISAQDDNVLSARFIKNGANDFITKPFVTEEFYCRVTQNIEMIEQIAKIKDISNKDFLTGLYNRRYFFELARKLYSSTERKRARMTIAMVDIDYFKKINDTYGHDVGDAVLKQLAHLLETHFGESVIVSRFGGEEFCILGTDMKQNEALKIFNNIRKTIENSVFYINDMVFKITVSIGVCNTPTDSLEGMIKQADEMLYEAKNKGRNRVMITMQ